MNTHATQMGDPPTTANDVGAKEMTTHDEEDGQVKRAMELSRSENEGTKFSAKYILRQKQYRRALYSSVPTLTLGIMGGAVLPVSWAFSVTGIGCGFLIMLVVALANTYTCDLLLRQTFKTGATDYESLAFLVGGRWWKLVTEISIVVLLVGSLVGGIQQTGEAAAIGILSLSGNAPHWLVGGSGRVLMALTTAFIVGPLCLVEKLRQLEYAATVGTAIVFWLVVSIMADSIKHGLPAIGTGLPYWGFSSIGSVTQAVSIFGFAFYIQPIMMPLYSEMPSGKVGVKLTSYTVRIVILGTSFFIYSSAGFFGAAYYGQDTQSNILQNQWLGGGVPQGILNLAMSLYLAAANPMVEFPTRHTINGWIPGDKEKYRFLRHIFETALILTFSTVIAVLWPNSSGKVLTVTGATGVCMVSYLIPIVNHLALFFRRAKCQMELLQTKRTNGQQNNDLNLQQQTDQVRNLQTDMEVANTAYPNAGPNIKEPDLLTYRKIRGGGTWGLIREYSWEVMLPLTVLAIGIFCSVASLSTL
ncbi:hypothetical protein O6H91_11G105900 [Diphasiastrum complanatum]|uniref:Uncharacterized protein n=1 Tax=Diphasiastrum complanatum TaxID=34168 RepID=A0ACC2CCG6_DIPCM|nr:hypothetical protein O6H91_Y376200 [Diphasiastrum complanatum]KAJ7539703.1 hypothetical protein O6H91_11G105900 [Diphasiastrum complanatum]